MGTPVSKSADNSLSELDATSGNYKEDATEVDIETGDACTGETAPPLMNFRESKQYQQIDEDSDGNVSDDIFNRLKTDRSQDLHNVNTRFNVNGHDRPKESVCQDAGDNRICSSVVAEGQTRIDPVDFNLHSAGDETEKYLINSVELSENNCSKNEPVNYLFANEHTRTGDVTLGSTDTSTIGETAVLLEQSKTKLNGSDFNEDHKDIKVEAGFQFLGIPSSTDGRLSPVQRSRSGSMYSDSDTDPMEGLEIPRNRVYSIGSTSVYSVKEISDDLYKQYMAEIKCCIRSYGFFEAFPSPSVIAEAQKLCRQLDMPSPVDEDGNVLPHPSKVRVKSLITADVESVKKISDIIMKMPAAMQKNGQTMDIVNYLCKGIEDDAYKLTMLLGWIVYQHHKSDIPDTTDDHWLKRLRALCKFARLKTRTIAGVIRGTSFMPGDDLEQCRGSWMAILVNHTWLLLDPHFFLSNNIKQKASTSSKQAVNTLSQSIVEQVDNMFQDPEQFIFTHFPDEEHWQLLARPVTRDEIGFLSLVRPAYFNLGLTLFGNGKSTVVVESQETSMSLSFPGNLKPMFKSKFHVCDKSTSDVRMRTYIFIETRFDQKKVNLMMRFPKKSSFLLHVFIRHGSSEWKSVLTTKFVYKGPHGIEPFPDNPREEWGPGLDSYLLGLQPKSHLGGQICIQRGIVQVVFGDERNLQYQHVLFRQDMKIDPKSLKVNILKDKNNDVIFVVDIDNKIQGIFTLQLSVREDKSSEYKTFCNYLIKKDKMSMVPKLEFNQSKETDKKVPIKVPETGQLSLTVPASGLIQLCVELKFHDRQELNFSEHARHWIYGDQGFIDLNFTRKGNYTLHVLGREVVNGKLIPLMKESYEVDIPSLKWSCFPKEGGYWNSWYKIETPLCHHLEEKKDVAFSVDVRNAQDVAVLGANGWYHLERADEEGDNWTWTGHVWTGPKATRCQLLARFEIGSDKWSDLLLFKVMSDEDYARMGDRQRCAIERARTENLDPSTQESGS